MLSNEKIAGRTGATAESRADIAGREFKLGLLSDLKRPLSRIDQHGDKHDLAIYVVGYVSLDVVVLSAPAALLESTNRIATWHAVFESLGSAALASLVLVEHAIGVDGIAGERLVGPVTVEVGQNGESDAADVTIKTRKVA